MNFYENFLKLCNNVGKSPSRVAEEIGISKSIVSRWKNGGGITDATAAKVAEYFGVSIFDIKSPVSIRGLQHDLLRQSGMANTARFIFDDDNQPLAEPTADTNVLTKKDQRDIARDLERIMADLDSSGDLMFDGDPLSDEAKESLRSAMKLGLEAAKLKNKERFTPKKYQKD